MAPKVKISEFVASTARYAKKAALAADKNSDGKVSLTESKALPVDLRDDYSRQAKLKSTITPAAFARDQAAYVARSAGKADKNKDGSLSAAEASALPADLKNNFANYARNAGGGVTLGSFVGKGRGKADTLDGKSVTRMPLATGTQSLIGKLQTDTAGMPSFAAAWKAKPADVAAAFANPAANMTFLNDLLFHSTGTRYQKDYPQYYTPDGLTAAPMTASAALTDLSAAFETPAAIADAKKLLGSIEEPGTKLLKLS